MGAATTFLNAFNIGAGAFDSINTTRETNFQLAYEADKSETLAAFKEQEARDALEKGEIAVEAHKRATRGNLGTMRAGYGASGVNVNSGTPVEVMADYAAWSDYERQQIEYEAARKSWGLNYEAAALKSDAYNLRASQTSVSGSAIKSLLGAGKDLLDLHQGTKKKK